MAGEQVAPMLVLPSPYAFGDSEPPAPPADAPSAPSADPGDGVLGAPLDAAAGGGKRRSKDSTAHIRTEVPHVYMRVGLDPQLEYYFRSVCNHCDATKSGTCKKSATRLSGSAKNRGQGRPAGSCWACCLHATSLPVPHTKADHAKCDLDFAPRKSARISLDAHVDFDESIKCLERDASPGPKPRADDPESLEPWDLPLR